MGNIAGSKPNQSDRSPGAQPPRRVDAIIVGAGFGGMYMLYKLRELGLTARVLEAGSGVGGTWYWNRYPGARCDIESVQYSYSFSKALEQEWSWSERYATQPEILRYANHVADRFDLRRDMQFDTRVTSAHFDDGTKRWLVTTERGERFDAQFCIMALGCLSAANKPKLAGLDSFSGPVYHTGEWPHEGVDFTGQRVGIVGTGSSAIQSIPVIAEQAAQLYVFQRTPNYAVPAHNQPLTPEYQKKVKADYAQMRAHAQQSFTGVVFVFNQQSALEVTPQEREREFEARWAYGGLPFMGAFKDLLFNLEANKTGGDFVRTKIRSIVRDPQLAQLLSPTNVFGCKRLCVDTGYYATFNRPNVTLVDVSGAPIERITPKGLRTAGKEYEFDALVLATGFDAMTGSFSRIDVRGRGGERLKDLWEAGPRTYLGLMTAGLPNFFMITGPGSPSVLANMILAIEQHGNWIAECIANMRTHGKTHVEPKLEAQDRWVEHVNEVAGGNLRSTCSSWYVGANVPGKPRVFMPYIGGYPTYAEKCREVVEAGYEGFAFA